jgi:hypothetical protein
MNENNEIMLPSLGSIKQLLEPIYSRLEAIESSIKQSYQKPSSTPKHYRNNDLKQSFGLSNNTIIKYRETGILPYTKLGDIYLYDVRELDKILTLNKVSL